MSTSQTRKPGTAASLFPAIEGGNWIAMATSVFLLGGGQLLKGHWRGLAAVWVALTAVMSLGTAIAGLGQPGSPLFLAGRSLTLGGALVLWAYQLLDALLRPSRASAATPVSPRGLATRSPEQSGRQVAAVEA